MKASIVIANAVCLTQDHSNVCEWIALSGEKILALGQGETYKEILSDWDVFIDAKKSTVLPGFIDSHFHVVQTALNSQCVDLGDAKSFKDIGERIDARHQLEPGKPIHAIRLDLDKMC